MGQWTTEGLQWALEVLFSEEQAVPANFYVGLAANVTITKDMTLADLVELGADSGLDPGYERQTIPSSNAGFTSSADGDNWKQTGAEVTFAATGDWDSTAYTWFLATSADNSGKLLCWDNLGEEIQLESGQTHVQTVVVFGNG